MLDRATIFREFLQANDLLIDYNGVVYTLVDAKSQVHIQTKTEDEMYTYILGYNKAIEKNAFDLNNAEKTNKLNVERYETIIRGLNDEIRECKDKTSSKPNKQKRNIESTKNKTSEQSTKQD